MKTLRKGEMCPVHKSFYCCGRKLAEKQNSKRVYIPTGVRRVEDQFHPRGFREICSSAELRRRKHTLMSTPKFLLCFYCHKDLRQSEYSEIDLCHLESKGMGGARRDDHISNLVLGHHSCNLENGSKSAAA